MEKHQWLIWTMLVLVAVVTGCSRAPRYDSRLVAADSLMHDYPDSALAIIDAVSLDSLATEADHAYRDLLITQARYKCYIVATTDSEINRALSYYQRHNGEREKLTRAYIYKGAVMEELGHPDSAMLYYKHAEATAAPDDYFNLGYVKFRIGYLYGNVYALNGKDIEKYEEAVDCFFHTNDTSYQIISLNNLGCVCRESKPQEAISFFHKALDLAHQLNDTSGIITVAYSMIVLFVNHNNYDEAQKYIQLIQHYKQVSDLNDEFYFCAASVYARLGVRDSAFLFLEQARQFDDNSAGYRMNLLDCLSEMALANNDTIHFLIYSRKCQNIADSLKSNKEKIELLDIETNFDKVTIKKEREESELIRTCLISVLIIALIMTGFIHYRRKRYYGELIKSIKREKTDQISDLLELRQRFNELQIQDEQLKDFIISHNNMMREVIDACYHEPRNCFANRVKQIIKYQDENKSLWERLYDYLDIEYNNIMKRTTEDYPQLNDKDRLLIALTCLNFSYIEISMILGYSNATTIGGNKQRVAKKMKLTYSLNDYVKQFQTNHNQ